MLAAGSYKMVLVSFIDEEMSTNEEMLKVTRLFPVQKRVKFLDCLHATPVTVDIIKSALNWLSGLDMQGKDIDSVKA